MASLRMQLPKDNTEKIQLARVSHVYIDHPDLQAFSAFAADFGFVEASRSQKDQTIYYRGFGRDPYCYVARQTALGQEKAFCGGAFVAQTAEDFEKARKLPGAKDHDLSGAPGGGQAVEITAPGGGRIYVIWGQKQREAPKQPATATTLNLSRYNTTLEKFRKGEFQRFKHGPAMIHKLGHFGYVSSTWDQDVAFYTSTFNFSPSDILYAPGNVEMDVLVFLHLDLGKEYSDHHALFLQRGPPPARPSVLHHCSFEIEDFDTQIIGHEHLLAKGYTPVWGVGRHILGSQIFDYWKDPSGFTIEHYADGDLVNEDTKPLRQEAGEKTLSVWGPAVPTQFV